MPLSEEHGGKSEIAVFGSRARVSIRCGGKSENAVSGSSARVYKIWREE